MKPFQDHRVPVTTTIARTQYDLIKKEKWRLNDLVSLGIAVKHDDNQAKEKITEYEYAQKNLMNVIKSLRSRIEAMEDRELGIPNEDTNTQ